MVIMLALTHPSRSADLSKLDLSTRSLKANGVEFMPTSLAKQSRQGKTIGKFFFPSCLAMPDLCPVLALKMYEKQTEKVRGNESRLFIAIIKPHKAVASSTIARWLKQFWRHQVWIHLYSMPTRYEEHHPQKLQTWGLRLMRSSKQQTGARSQSSRGSITNQPKSPTMVERCSPVKWNLSYKQHRWYVRLSLLKYNSRMAQTTKWLQAIRNCMKKVKSIISTVPPTRSWSNW